MQGLILSSVLVLVEQALVLEEQVLAPFGEMAVCLLSPCHSLKSHYCDLMTYCDSMTEDVSCSRGCASCSPI